MKKSQSSKGNVMGFVGAINAASGTKEMPGAYLGGHPEHEGAKKDARLTMNDDGIQVTVGAFRKLFKEPWENIAGLSNEISHASGSQSRPKSSHRESCWKRSCAAVRPSTSPTPAGSWTTPIRASSSRRSSMGARSARVTTAIPPT